MNVHGQENNWFKQNEILILEQAAHKRKKRMAEMAAKQGQEALDKLRTAHWMKCPKCGHDMEAVTFEGIEVESCTYCMGVFFERGEIESLLFRRTPQRFTFYRKFFGLD